MAEKADANPMQSAHAAPRCTARSKRTGRPCRNPAVCGWKVCRMHGAGGGAPDGRENGAYKHGLRSLAHRERQAELKALIATVRQTLDSL
ncbi:MAG: hypothetical protein CMB79_06495 [Filomicrobium sp.]|nr:hypothetical protein [Filomicrobium sp.]